MPSPRYGRERSQLTYGRRQGHLREFRVAVTLRRGGKGREGREGNQVQQPGGPKVQREGVTKMVGLYREGLPEEGQPMGWIIHGRGIPTSQEGAVTWRAWGMLGEPGSLCIDMLNRPPMPLV